MDDNFERQWRDAFEDASQEPPKIVWSEISSRLASEKLVLVQRQKMFYQVGIAATILITAFVGLSQFFLADRSTNQQVAQRETIEIKGLAMPIYTPEFGGPTNYMTNSGEVLPVGGDATEGMATEVSSEEDDFNWSEIVKIELFDEELNSKAAALAVEYPKVRDHLYGRPRTYLAKSKSKNREKFWAGVDVGSGSFDPNFQGGDTNLQSSLAVQSNAFASASLKDNSVRADSPPVREDMTSGTTVGLGVNFGFELGDRWYVQSGVQYSRASATNSTNVVVETRQSVNPIAASAQFNRVSQIQDLLNAEEVVSFEYKDVNLDNQFQFASIPLVAGYKIIDQRINLSINAGVASNIYLGNKITDPGNTVAEVTIGPGESSPYRQVNFMGITGVQVGYEIMNRFDVIVQPNYRHALNPLTKADADFTTNPSGFGLQTGMRYRFN